MTTKLQNCISLIFILLMSATASFSQSTQQMSNNEIPAEYGYIVKIGDTVPAFAAKLAASGKEISTVDFAGKVVMLQFTASWCGVCRKEMPFIERDIWLKLNSNPKFLLYGIDLDEPAEKVNKFAKAVDITYPLALDPKGEIFGLFAKKEAGVTRNVIIDKTGKIVYMTRLFKEDEFNEMVKVINELLK